jgi:hypothetical protein
LVLTLRTQDNESLVAAAAPSLVMPKRAVLPVLRVAAPAGAYVPAEAEAVIPVALVMLPVVMAEIPAGACVPAVAVAFREAQPAEA